MNFVSTRGGVGTHSIRQAIEAGLAPDGGLFVPEQFTRFQSEDFKHASTLPEIAGILLRPFFEGDPELASSLMKICERTFSFPIPLSLIPDDPHSKGPHDFWLELYHGPTSAFKDVGARFLAECTEVISLQASSQRKTVLVATSGDTGGAVAAAFYGKQNLDVVILFPKDRISKRQEAQLCAWGGNVHAFAVRGTFDDCQKMVKAGLGSAKYALISANSINLGRILPQMVYYAFAALQIKRSTNTALDPGFIIPSGNLGNALACLWAKHLGLPIGPVKLAFNANHSVVDYFQSGIYEGHPAMETLANAMDVGSPSNFERLSRLFPDHQTLKQELSAECVHDSEIREEIAISENEWGQALCPHSATAARVRRRMKISNSSTDAGRRWVLVATAHPAKFESVVEPLIGHLIPIPAALQEILNRPSSFDTIEPDFNSIPETLFHPRRFVP